MDDWPPLISAAGTTISCMTWDMPAKTQGIAGLGTRS